jgi:hypothetical protein
MHLFKSPKAQRGYGTGPTGTDQTRDEPQTLTPGSGLVKPDPLPATGPHAFDTPAASLRVVATLGITPSRASTGPPSKSSA